MDNDTVELAVPVFDPCDDRDSVGEDVDVLVVLVEAVEVRVIAIVLVRIGEADVVFDAAIE